MTSRIDNFISEVLCLNLKTRRMADFIMLKFKRISLDNGLLIAIAAAFIIAFSGFYLAVMLQQSERSSRILSNVEQPEDIL